MILTGLEYLLCVATSLSAPYHNIMAQPPAQPDLHLLGQQLAGISEQVKLLPNMPAVAGFEAVLANMTQQHDAVLAQLAQLAQQQTAALAQQAQQHAAALAQQAEQHTAALTQQAEQHAAVLAQQAEQHAAAQAQLAQLAQQHAGQHQQTMDLLNAFQASLHTVIAKYVSYFILPELSDFIFAAKAATLNLLTRNY